ncbi:MAG TPA: hypothetical protein VF601_14955 [Beijerinckiaceae bacterium]|jgi:plasmid stability protein
MGQVLVRNIDDAVVAGLKVKARLAGVSFETFLREQLKAIAPLTGDERGRLLEQFARENGGFPKVKTCGGDLIGGMREEEG